MKVSQQSWHERAWLFTVASGVIGCTKPPFPGQVTFDVGGTTYALKSSARDQGFQSAHPILRSDPTGRGKMSVATMIQRGLKLCDESD
jgi:hypothetical protein